ncbi:MAG: hypothetical protein Q8929_16610, partial [Bacillota bacterium]|nr:hypothetical protein [Bacillota bacterium]
PCDRYVVKLEGESPLRALVRRTVREGKGVHREMESEESRIQNVDLTNRKCIKAGVLRTRVRMNPKSNTYSEETNVFATG